MFLQFFANKPVERLIGPGSVADDLNDDVLGRCLVPSLRPMSAPCIR